MSGFVFRNFEAKVSDVVTIIPAASALELSPKLIFLLILLKTKVVRRAYWLGKSFETIIFAF